MRKGWRTEWVSDANNEGVYPDFGNCQSLLETWDQVQQTGIRCWVYCARFEGFFKIGATCNLRPRIQLLRWHWGEGQLVALLANGTLGIEKMVLDAVRHWGYEARPNNGEAFLSGQGEPIQDLLCERYLFTRAAIPIKRMRDTA